MKIEKVLIDCNDNFKHTQIAFIVDRDDFRLDAYRIRHKWFKNKKLMSFNEYFTWWSNLFETSRKDLEKRKLQKEVEKLKIETFNAYTEGHDKNNRIENAINAYAIMEEKERTIAISDFEYDIKSLLLKYHLPETYYEAMCRIVMCGAVNDKLWTSCLSELQPAYQRYSYYGQIIKEPFCEFIITAYTTKRDLIQLFEEKHREIIRLYETSEYGFIKYAEDTISNIRRDRKWHWKNLPINEGGEAKSQVKIVSEEYGEDNIYNDKDIVRKALKQYRKHLHKKLGES